MGKRFRAIVVGMATLAVVVTIAGCSSTSTSSSSLASSSGSPSASASASTASEDAVQHSQMTLELKEMLDNDSELKALVEKSLAKAWEINPDPRTNPAKNLDELYKFTDWAEKCLPWEIVEGQPGIGVYEHIDQSLDAFYFLFDQPLEELEGRGYYYPSLQYHAPIRG